MHSPCVPCDSSVPACACALLRSFCCACCGGCVSFCSHPHLRAIAFGDSVSCQPLAPRRAVPVAVTVCAYGVGVSAVRRVASRVRACRVARVRVSCARCSFDVLRLVSAICIVSALYSIGENCRARRPAWPGRRESIQNQLLGVWRFLHGKRGPTYTYSST
jgi:hypothetical protein